ncbi:MAG: hypothetical protein HS132_06875 [Planctomycetia bacterium]|nr:hypothetical protein [Planctomycetia bacterium]
MNDVTFQREDSHGASGRRASWDDTNNNNVIDTNETVFYGTDLNHKLARCVMRARVSSELFENYANNFDSVLVFTLIDIFMQ